MLRSLFISLIFLRAFALMGCEDSLLNNQYVLIGSGGFLGSELAKGFSKIGNSIGLSRSPSAWTQRVGLIENYSLEDWNSKITMHKEPVVIFAAGRPSVAEATRDPDGDYKALITPLKKVLEFMNEGTLVFISSAAVLEPTTNYAQHRILAEELIKEHAKQHSRFKYHILRPTNVFGEHQRKQIIYDLSLRLIQDHLVQKETLLWGSGEELRDFIHVDYIVDFCVKLILQKIPSNTWNLSSGKPIKMLELINSIQSFFSLPKNYRFNEKPQNSESLKIYRESEEILSPAAYTFERRIKNVLGAYQDHFNSQNLP
jgi:nucleoside-diphosphate-sugar epimerase